MPGELTGAPIKMEFQQHCLIVQCCINCSQHYSYTRHIEERYQERYDGISHLMMNDPETKTVVVLKNKIPKAYHIDQHPHDIKNYGKIVENKNHRN